MLDMKTIYLIVISSLIGGAIGFGVSYVILNGQIRGLQQDLTTIATTVGRITDATDNMTTTIATVVDTLASGLTAVSEYATMRVDQLQTQLDKLNITIADLNTAINEIGTETWHTVATATAGPDLPTEHQQETNIFNIQGNKIQISWNMKGNSANASIHIQIHHSNGQIYSALASSGYYGTFTNELTIQPGDYYLRIITTNVDHWTVIARDLY